MYLRGKIPDRGFEITNFESGTSNIASNAKFSEEEKTARTRGVYIPLNSTIAKDSKY